MGFMLYLCWALTVEQVTCVRSPSVGTRDSGDDGTSVGRVSETRALSFTPLGRQLAWMLRVAVKTPKYVIIKISDRVL